MYKHARRSSKQKTRKRLETSRIDDGPAASRRVVTFASVWQPFRRTDFTNAPPRRVESPSQRPDLPIPYPAKNQTPETRIVIIAKRDELLPKIMAIAYSVTTKGDDWHIQCLSRQLTEQLVQFLKMQKVHGVLRTRKRLR